MTQRRRAPHSPEAERATLAAVLLDPSCLPEVEGRVATGDFFLPAHRAIFESMQALDSHGKPIDLRTLQAQLENRGLLDLAGGVAYLARLDFDLPDLSRVGHYAGIVRDRSTARQVQKVAEAIAASASAGDPAALAPRAAELARLVADGETAGVSTTLADEADAIVARLLALRNGSREVGVPFGFPTLDRAVVGLAPGDLGIFGAYSGVGKTTFVEQLLVNWLRRDLVPLYVPVEMARWQVLDRLTRRLLQVPITALRKGMFAERVVHELGERLKAETWPRNLRLCFPRTRELETVVREIKAELRRRPASIVVVDHLHRLIVPSARSDKRLEVTRAVEELKELALSEDVPVFVPAQVARDAVKGEQRPRSWHLKESGKIEEEADLVLMGHREKDPARIAAGESGLLEVLVDKARQGDEGALSRFQFYPRTGELAELAPGDVAADIPF